MTIKTLPRLSYDTLLKVLTIRNSYLRQISLKRESLSFDNYPFTIPAIKRLHTLRLHPNVTFLVGENGCGKSTLLEGIATALGFNPEGGSINFKFATRESHSGLSNHLRLVRSSKRPRDGYFLRAESFYNVASDIERLDQEPSFSRRIIESYGNRSLHEQSHGESFLALLLHRFGGNGLYILDEPEAALSPVTQLAVLRRIHQLVLDDSQFVIATHSPILMLYPKSRILRLTEAGFTSVNYEQTDHYIITKRLLGDPVDSVRLLLEAD